MTWVKIDDGFYDHPKVASLPPQYMLPAIGLHVLALCYCARNLTDGFVPEPQIDRLAGSLTDLLPQGNAAPLIEALLDAGLWELPADDREGYVMHDYLAYNPSRRLVQTHRRAVSRERAKAGAIGNEARWSAHRAENTGEKRSQTDRKRIATTLANGSQTDRPVPVPVPLTTKEESTASVSIDADAPPPRPARATRKRAVSPGAPPPEWSWPTDTGWPDGAAPTPALLAALYNRLKPAEFTSVTMLTDERNRKAARYLHQFPEFSFWRRVFEQLARSEFLRGLRNGDGHASFRADFDWLLTVGKDGTENAVKVAEGKYDDEPRRSSSPAPKEPAWRGLNIIR